MSWSGFTQGYVILNYIKTHLPLGPNEHYIYIGIPAHCKEQVLLNGLGVSAAMGTYFTNGLRSSPNDANPNSVGIVVRWNSVTNTGTAALLTLDRKTINDLQNQDVPLRHLDLRLLHLLREETKLFQRFADIVVFPTPPFPEATTITLAILPPI